MKRNVLNYSKRGSENIPKNKTMTAAEMNEIYERVTASGTSFDNCLWDAMIEAFNFGFEVGRECAK